MAPENTGPIETFADVLHHIIDVVLTGDTAAKAHAVIDQASGPRTVDPEAEAAAASTEAAPAETTEGGTEDVPATGAGETVPGA